MNSIEIIGDSRLIGLGRDDGLEYVDWIRRSISGVGAHIPYYAENNQAALKKLEELSLINAHLDFITTDLVNVYLLAENRIEGVEFIQQVRTLSNDLLVSGGLRLKRLPIIVFTGGGFTFENIKKINRIDPSIPVVSKSNPDELPNKLIKAITSYRHNVLAEFQRNGLAAFWSEGKFRLGTAHSLPTDFQSKYYAGNKEQVSSAYSRLVVITGTSSISDIALEEFEDLLNSKSTRERDLQELFKRHPELLMGDEYDSYWAEPILVSPATGEKIRPDFVLQPLALRSNPWRWNIVDLKRHDFDLLIEKRFHVDLSRQVYRAATQLRDYSDFFADPRNSDIIKERFGGFIPSPQLTMIIGRFPDSERAKFNKLQGRVAGVHIRTYDEILEFRRAQLDKLRYISG
jgi:hypothetical protein